MPNILPYNRQNAVSYAKKWALSRNPEYFDFSNLGGDCTNFASQCLYAGSKIMNYTPVYGWYYNNPNDKSPSWTGVNELYRFLVTNKTRGVFAAESDISQIMPADLIQLGDASGRYYHSLIVVQINESPDINNILISTHTFDSNLRPLSSYYYQNIRFLHIAGVYIP
ncbi:MAG: amidase domain-containing protein [Clostridia bacterium]|nr:amidase domain-containing protein [Clostridia bacterium]